MNNDACRRRPGQHAPYSVHIIWVCHTGHKQLNGVLDLRVGTLSIMMRLFNSRPTSIIAKERPKLCTIATRLACLVVGEQWFRKLDGASAATGASFRKISVLLCGCICIRVKCASGSDQE